MRRLAIIFFCVLLLFTQIRYVFSQDRAWDLSESRVWKDAVIPGLIATGETLFWNVLPLSFNMALGESWAIPSSSSIRRNLTSRWLWEKTDDFVVNQIGHPYHGSLYFNSGRVNGFGYYGSLFFSVLGSFTWETFGEANRAGFNDFISTTTGSMFTGEVLYRLYAEAYAAGVPAPLAFLINPTAGIHSLVSGWKPDGAGRNLHEFQIYLGIGYAKTRYLSVSGREKEQFFFKGPFAGLGIKAVYGNPFEQDTWVPYRHFELAVSLGMNPGSFSDFRITSDGYLFSFSPLYTDKDEMSTGLSLNFDFVSLGKFSFQDSTINQYSNALDWTVKYQHLFSLDTAFQAKLHAGFTFMGVSNYYSPNYFHLLFTKKEELDNFGYGFNAKRYYRLKHGKRGMLEVSRFYYAVWTYPGAANFSSGFVHWHFTDITYSFLISKHISIGVTGFLAAEYGSFSGFPATRKRNSEAKLFIAWNL